MEIIEKNIISQNEDNKDSKELNYNGEVINKKMNENKNIKKNRKSDECVELKNINYKNMLLKGSNLSNNEEKYDNKILDKFLEQESELSRKEHWLKLDKPDKLLKLKNYGITLIEKYNLNENEITNMNIFFNNCVD